MDYVQSVLVSFSAGVLAGIFNYAALWITVSKLPSSRRPSLLGVTSFILRMTVILAVFYLIIRVNWQSLLICLLGFLMVRSLILRHFRSARKRIRMPAKGV